MNDAFGRLSEAVELEDRAVGRRFLVVGQLLCLVWIGWLLWGTIDTFAISDAARIEVKTASASIEMPEDGVVESSDLTLGRKVEAGDVLVVLDSRAERLERDLEVLKLEQAESLAALVARQIELGTAARAAAAKAAKVATVAGRSKAKELESAVALAARESAVAQSLLGSSSISRMEAFRSAEQAERARRAHSTAIRETELTTTERGMNLRDRESSLLALDRTLQDVKSQIRLSSVRIQQIDIALSKKILRAPIAGTVADIAVLTPGRAIGKGLHVASIVPQQEHRVVAQFKSADAGRLVTGQPAIVRVDSYPWLQFGSLDAVVTEVARESREGTFRVELDLVGAGRFPPSHGLTGSVQVTVDRAKPWEYVAQVVTPLLAPRRNDGAQQPQATR